MFPELHLRYYTYLARHPKTGGLGSLDGICCRSLCVLCPVLCETFSQWGRRGVVCVLWELVRGIMVARVRVELLDEALDFWDR